MGFPQASVPTLRRHLPAAVLAVTLVAGEGEEGLLAEVDDGGREFGHRRRRVDDLAAGLRPSVEHRADQLLDAGIIDRVGDLGLLGQLALELAPVREGQDVIHDRLLIAGRQQVERRHRGPADSPADRPDQVLAERLRPVRRGGELEDPAAIVAGLRQQVRGGDAVAVARDAVALHAVSRVHGGALLQMGLGDLGAAEEPGRLRGAALLPEDREDPGLLLGLELLDLCTRVVHFIRRPRTSGECARKEDRSDRTPYFHGIPLCLKPLRFGPLRRPRCLGVESLAQPGDNYISGTLDF